MQSYKHSAIEVQNIMIAVLWIIFGSLWQCFPDFFAHHMCSNKHKKFYVILKSQFTSISYTRLPQKRYCYVCYETC